MESEVRKNELMSQHTTLHVGGVADYFVVVKSEEELRAALLFALKQTTTPPFIFGGGSNILVSDEGYRGVVIKMELKGIEFSNDSEEVTLVTAQAGEAWDTLVQQTIEQGLSGLENLSGIPGTVGAAPVQNINAYGATVADYIKSVTVLNRETFEVKQLTKEECNFGYRDSIFKHTEGEGLVILSVTFQLTSANQTTLSYRSSSQSIADYLSKKGVTKPSAKDVREAVLHARSNIGMLDGQFRSAGSFFKNVTVSKSRFEKIQKLVEENFPEQNKKFSPWHWSVDDNHEKIATAFLLECSPYNKDTFGKKRINHVGFSPKHSLSIVTEPGATAHDVEHFSQLVAGSVEKIFSITLESEVLFV